MSNQPLSSSGQFKILIFFLLLVFSVVLYGIGLLPAIFIGFGLFMMKKNKDFSFILTAEKSFNIYYVIVLVISIIIAAATYGDDRVYALFFTFLAFAYILLGNLLFFALLKAHSEWVEINGIFPNTAKQKSSTTKADIIEDENFGKNSVADELTKWAKLKEDGHISEEEFNEVRKKLLKQT